MSSYHYSSKDSQALHQLLHHSLRRHIKAYSPQTSRIANLSEARCRGLVLGPARAPIPQRTPYGERLGSGEGRSPSHDYLTRAAAPTPPWQSAFSSPRRLGVWAVVSWELKIPVDIFACLLRAAIVCLTRHQYPRFLGQSLPQC